MKKWIPPLFAGAAAGLVLAAALIILLTRPKSFSALRGGREFNVIVVTLDTTRADKIGAYGCAEVETPVIDRFASRGLRFERCIAQTPLTLPSHTSIMTGSFPPFHGVRDNGGFLVPPGMETLAEVFKKSGYQTGAFVSSYVLDSRWGLNQGFDFYYDRFDLSKFETVSLGNIQRPADEVFDEALPWLEGKRGGKFFAWIHLYDPHTPYEPPAPYDKAYEGRPYLGEIAFMDSQLGRLETFLQDSGLAENTFVVLAGDHGESLGQHQEHSHGFFVYQEAVHVPLIISVPFSNLQGRATPQVASLADIMPTLLEMCGLPAPAGVQGRSRTAEFFRPGENPDDFAYSETYYARFHYGWSEIRSIQDGRYKLIISPDLELYDLKDDPGELHNLAETEISTVRTMRAEAEAIFRRYGQNAQAADMGSVDEETREKLAALGYVGSFTDPAQLAGRILASPKDKIGIFNELSQAREMGLSGKAAEAVARIKEIISRDPDIIDAYFSLGNIYFRERNYEEALRQFKIALGLKPNDSFTVINIANCYVGLRRPDEAEAFVLDFLAGGVRDSQLFFLLGNINFRREQYDRAIPYFRECLSLNSESASAYNALAAIYYLKDDLEEAEKNSREAIRRNPRLSAVHYNLAQILEKKGRIEEAEAEYKTELEIAPSHFKAVFNLARLYRLAGRIDEEKARLEQGLKLAPEFPLNYFYLARINLNRGEKFEESVDLVLKGLALEPAKSELPLGYFLLADLYNRLGDAVRSAEFARKGEEATARLR